MEHLSDFEKFIAVSNLLILLLSLIIAGGAYISQRSHNIKSVKPILQLVLGDYEHDLYVKIYNNGVGPGIIKSISVTSEHNDSIRRDMISYFENLDWEWDTFNTGLEGLAISPNSNTILIQMKEPNNNQKARIREILSNLSIDIEYTDIYGINQDPIHNDLRWFGRDHMLRKNNIKIKPQTVMNTSGSQNLRSPEKRNDDND